MVDGYGGGNCQVSSTIYNAIKDLDGIDVVERHHHAKDVPYVKKVKMQLLLMVLLILNLKTIQIIQ